MPSLRFGSRLAASVVAGSLALSGLSACTRANGQPARAENKQEAGQSPVTVLPHPALAQAGGSATIADIAEKALPSVVNIAMTKLSRMPQQPMFFPFFGPPGSEERKEQGLGSGVIVSADGFIVTNNHVVSDASEIKVTTYDKREFDAEVVGTDPKTDLALIKLKGQVSGLSPIQFGDATNLRLGDVVLAIGNPFGVGQTVTMGIVSAKGRADLGIIDYEDFIQTDAAINPGNSGGALVNMEGKLVGINTAILSRSGGYQGVGFAIPSNMASPILDSLKKFGKVTRGWLGVSIQDVDQELVAAMKLPVTRGILISDVRPGTPAAKAGLRRGDVVTKVDGRAIDSTGQFRNYVAGIGSGKKATFEIVREGQTVNVVAELGDMPADEGIASSSAPQGGPQSGVLDGLTLGEITPEARRAFGIPAEVQKGVVVTRLKPGSPAAEAGLRPGDVLLEVNRKPVNSVAEFEAAYKGGGDKLLLLVHRKGATVFVVVKR
jgi:serine protease Do